MDEMLIRKPAVLARDESDRFRRALGSLASMMRSRGDTILVPLFLQPVALRRPGRYIAVSRFSLAAALYLVAGIPLLVAIVNGHQGLVDLAGRLLRGFLVVGAISTVVGLGRLAWRPGQDAVGRRRLEAGVVVLSGLSAVLLPTQVYDVGPSYERAALPVILLGSVVVALLVVRPFDSEIRLPLRAVWNRRRAVAAGKYLTPWIVLTVVIGLAEGSWGTPSLWILLGGSLSGGELPTC